MWEHKNKFVPFEVNKLTCRGLCIDSKEIGPVDVATRFGKDVQAIVDIIAKEVKAIILWSQA